ncbi:aminotransferase class I/II-fold pyridoxal phosphate-dependent enzyme [bacterium]|nr:aminotransferase class I/II-fold pyridoxal phosphate-dependent enzyme [bacterium]MBU1152877.1 aminotransferase class I/II-fold pyridoxal phosphate-dependent enzyme [bacterium]
MKKLLSQSVLSIPPSGIRRFFDIIATLDDVISLGIGEPDFDTPWHIRELSIYHLEQGYTNYTSNSGLIKLRETISQRLNKDYQLKYDPVTQILVTVGVSEGLDLALRAILNLGDEVIVHEPSYVSYKPCIIMAGGVPVVVETKLEDDFQLKAEEIEKVVTKKTKALIISYPNNPTGAIMEKDRLSKIAQVVKKHNLLVIADEIYEHLTYEGSSTCFAALPEMKERTILLNGFSKAYAMTGWRIGYAASHQDIIEAMTKIHQYTMLCAPIMGQQAAIEALKNGYFHRQDMITEYNQRRRLIIKGLNEIGLNCFTAKGAFYVFPSIINSTLNDEEFAERLLLEERVAVIPGGAFGKSGRSFIRCSYATSLDKIEEALERIRRFFNRYKR